MHRQRLLNLLDTYAQRYSDEQATLLIFKSFVTRHTECFERRLSIGHVTASCWLLNPTNTKVLLTHHRKLDRWLQLGGHADGEPDVLTVALREAREESGIDNIQAASPEIFDLDIHTIPARKSEAQHQHYDLRFILQASTSEKTTLSSESKDLAWVPFSKLKTYSQDPSILRMKEKWLKQKDSNEDKG